MYTTKSNSTFQLYMEIKTPISNVSQEKFEKAGLYLSTYLPTW